SRAKVALGRLSRLACRRGGGPSSRAEGCGKLVVVMPRRSQSDASRAIAVITSLGCILLSCAYDWTVPAGSSSASSSGGPAPAPSALCTCSPCIQCGMENCAVVGNVDDCVAFESCAAPCQDALCKTTCTTSHIAGVQFFDCLTEQCQAACATCPGANSAPAP